MSEELGPYAEEVKAGKSYFWCSCGKSLKQPYCDGSHKSTKNKPLEFKSENNKKVFFCICKRTKTPPFCDGSHSKNDSKIKVLPDNVSIDISENETILTSSLRNNIPHLNACGGIGKCSTCRVEILSGLDFCSQKTEVELKLSKKLSFPDSIRLACQTKVFGYVEYRRLLLDKRDINLNSQLNSVKVTSVGTIRKLTIMFCDIRGFTPFSESLSAYDTIFILNRYFSIMREVILKNGGEINNYIGDAILAIFGMKESRQQTLRAVNTGIEMLEAMDEFKKYLKSAYGNTFDMRIGIHFGEVIVGSVGQDLDKKITVIGENVNIASRIEAINKDAGTRLLISEEAHNEIKDKVDINNYLRLKLRGTSKLITLYEVNNIKKESLVKFEDIQEKTINGKKWLRTLPSSELNSGEKKKFQTNKYEILLIKNDSIYAINNNCPHMNLPLDVAQITDDTILCPYHNSEFSYKTGEVKKWIGESSKNVIKEGEPLKCMIAMEQDSYIWVQIN